jgi:stage IV sporulation protein FB
MAKLKISFNPIFIIFAFLVFYFGWAKSFLVYIIVLLLHELAHYMVARMFGYKLNKIIFMPYGASLSGESNIFKPSHEIIIALAGPLLNILLVLIGVSLWWLEPITFSYTETFVISNLVLGVFNLLPVFPLDGGRVLVALMSNYTSKVKLYKAMRIVGLAFSFLFAALFFISVFFKINLTLIFISIFLLISSVNNVKDVYYERTIVKSFGSDLSKLKAVELKTYAVSSKMPLLKLIKYIKGNNFTQFVVINENGEVMKTLTENDIKKLVNLK